MFRYLVGTTTHGIIIEDVRGMGDDEEINATGLSGYSDSD